MTRWPERETERAMVRPLDIPSPVTRIVLRLKVEDLLRHWRVCLIFWVEGWNRESRLLRMVMSVMKGVKNSARRIRDRFWRRWREVGEEALRGIVAAESWGEYQRDVNAFHELHFKAGSLQY